MDLHNAAFYRYHQHTKHTLAKLRGRSWQLDWDNQPNPFRRYDGAQCVPLPQPAPPPQADYFRLQDAVTSGCVSIQTVAQLLYGSMAIATWKEVPERGLRWALRVNPSSGNLHPTETHLLSRGVEGLDDGCYHFAVDDFCLETRHSGPTADLAALLGATCGLPASPLTILLTSIFWREAWKYRDRAFRYCHLDLGHALAALTEAARGLGLPVSYRHLFDDPQVAEALGLSGGDEAPGLLIAVGAPTEIKAAGSSSPRRFAGQPNALSDEIVEYESIATVYTATCRTGPHADPRRRELEFEAAPDIALPTPQRSDKNFWQVVRTRRSGVDFDGQTGTDIEALGAILQRATRGADGDLFNTPKGGGRSLVHLYLYVHRVAGLAAGLYYHRSQAHAVVLLRQGDLRPQAAALSLQQAIAADGAFAVSMIADLAGAYAAYGERGYRAVHIEAGYIGQGLYLGAESLGLNATGIGAFFDDEVNRYLELPGGFEVIYHFTVGQAVPDPRLANRPAYPFSIEPWVDDVVC